MTLLLAAWLAWVSVMVLTFLLAALVEPQNPCFNGFRIIMPGWLADMLTIEEIEAVYWHERGHRHYGHVWHNLAAACCFLPAGPERRFMQELQADDFAVERGYRLPLASALRKIARHRDATARMRRLVAMVGG